MPVAKGRFFAPRAIEDLVHEIFSTGHNSYIPIHEECAKYPPLGGGKILIRQLADRIRGRRF